MASEEKHWQSVPLVMWFGVLAVVVSIHAGCGSERQPITGENSEFKIAGDDDTEATQADSTTAMNPPPAAINQQLSTINQPPAGKPPLISAAQLNQGQYEIPQGTPEQIMDWVQGHFQRGPQGSTEGEMRANFQALLTAAAEAAERVYTSSDANAEVRYRAAAAKIQILMGRGSLGEENVADQLNTLATEFRADKEPRIARLGRLIQFEHMIGEFAKAQTKPDPTNLINEMQSLLALADKDEAVMQLTLQGAMSLQAAGLTDEATAVFKQVGEAYRGNSNPELAAQAEDVLAHVALVEVKFSNHLASVINGNTEATPLLLASIDKILASAQVSPFVLGRLEQAAGDLEIRNQIPLGIEVCRRLRAAHQKLGTTDAGQLESLNSLERRLSLVGQPMVVAGKLTDGTPFDWAPYKGKVVLVDFWATWSEESLQEIPNIERNLELYGQRGFSVVGINLDEDQSALTQFLRTKSLPWPTIVNDLADPNSMSKKCGVDMRGGSIRLAGKQGRNRRFAARARSSVGSPLE